MNLSELKQTIVSGDKPGYVFRTAKGLEEHLDNLRGEFVGSSELVFFHAQLIVLLRRGVEVEQTYQMFGDLWKTEAEFLTQHLNTRWLVAAADTFADHSKDPTVRAISLNVAMLINTIKLSETERFITDAQTLPIIPEKLAAIQTTRIALGDGTTAFQIGTDDTLRNMRWRLDRVADYDHPISTILKTVFDRVQTFDSVYKRCKDMHQKERTEWW